MRVNLQLLKQEYYSLKWKSKQSDRIKVNMSATETSSTICYSMQGHLGHQIYSQFHKCLLTTPLCTCLNSTTTSVWSDKPLRNICCQCKARSASHRSSGLWLYRPPEPVQARLPKGAVHLGRVLELVFHVQVRGMVRAGPWFTGPADSVFA